MRRLIAACRFTIALGGAAAATHTTSLSSPVVSNLLVTPNSWSGFGAHESVTFTCAPQWSDGVGDAACARAPHPTRWTVSNYGRLAGASTGAVIVWNSGHGAGQGELSVSYAGATARLPLRGRQPTKPALGVSYFTATQLPEATDAERHAYAKRAQREGPRFRTEKMAEAQTLSDALADHIRRWLDGTAPAQLPPGLLPPSIDNEKTRAWTLCRPDDVRPEDQWFWRPAMSVPEDFSQLYFLGPDNHCTYLKLMFVAPFGCQLVIEGEFPHCRFMDYQISPPFDPETPTTTGLGCPEVPIADVDIAPLSGHVNPFRPGAARNGARRGYRVAFDLAQGNAVALNPQAMTPPAYRAPGNTRVGGPFTFAGPQGLGVLLPAVAWLRYYAPNHGTGPFAGVPLPKAYMRLPTGETFWLKCDFSVARRRQTVAVSGFATSPTDPPPYLGPEEGWWKIFGTYLVTAEGLAYVTAKPWGQLPREWAAGIVRKLDEDLWRRGPSMPPPGNYECSASFCNYINYLVRPIALGPDKVIVISGKLPTTPRTRQGEAVMSAAQLRYWSIAHYADSPDAVYPSILYGCLMDDELTLDKQRRYIIAYSRRDEQPRNAVAAAGVTWQDWGPQSRGVLQIRLMNVPPDWTMDEFSADEVRLPWSTTAWSAKAYDVHLIGRNQPGALGPYHPIIHYMTRAEFEALGPIVSADALPEWRREKKAASP